MANFIKEFVDWAGLEGYDGLLKEYISANYSGKSELGDINTTIANINDIVTRLDGADTDEGSVKQQIKDAIDNMIDGASSALDTFKEIESWINDNENSTAQLIAQVNSNSAKLEGIEADFQNIKNYVDINDQKYYNLISSVTTAKISSLFREETVIVEGTTYAEAIANLTKSTKLTLDDTVVIAEDVVVPENAYIDANGAEFAGTIFVPNSATIDGAVFTGVVIIEEA